MIELKINGVTLPLPAGTKITRNLDSTVFNRSNEAADYTFPIEVPLTEDAVVALGFPNMLENTNVNKSYTAEYYIDGYQQGTVIVSVLGVSLSKKTCSLSILGKSVIANAIGTKKVNELILGGDRFMIPVTSQANVNKDFTVNGYNMRYIQNPDQLNHMRDVALGNIVTDYLFPTFVDYGKNLDVIHNDTTINFINAYDDYQTKNYIDPNWHYIRTLFMNGMTGLNERFWIVPMFRLMYIVKQCFAEFGWNVSGAVFTDPVYKDIVLYNTYAINGFSYNLATTPVKFTMSDALITPSNHMPNMKILEFLEAVMKRLNLFYSYDQVTNTVNVIALSSGAASFPKVIDISDIADPNPEINFVLDDNIDSYTFSFDGDPSDELSTGFDTTLQGYTIIGTVNSMSDLSSVATTNNKQLVYVRSTNQYLYYDVDWTVLCDNLIDYETRPNASSQTIKTKALSMPMRMETYHANSDNGATSSEFTDMLLPASSIGIAGGPFTWIEWSTGGGSSFPWTLGRTVPQQIDIYPHLINSYGMRVFKQVPVGGLMTQLRYPVASAGNIDMMGSVIGTASGGWHAPNNSGHADVFWSKLVNAIANALSMDVNVLFDILKFRDFDIDQTLLTYQGLNFLCQKAEINLPFRELSKLTLVRMQ